jgi:hypothetical protein
MVLGLFVALPSVLSVDSDMYEVAPKRSVGGRLTHSDHERDHSMFGHQVLDGGDLSRFDRPFWEDEGVDPRSTTSRFFHQSGEGCDVERRRRVVSEEAECLIHILQRPLERCERGCFDGEWPRRQQDFETAALGPHLAQGLYATPVDVDGVELWDYANSRRIDVGEGTVVRQQVAGLCSKALPGEESGGQTNPRHVSSEIA